MTLFLTIATACSIIYFLILFLNVLHITFIFQLMKEKLQYAITNCIEMDADFKLAEPDIAGWALPAQEPLWAPMYSDE